MALRYPLALALLAAINSLDKCAAAPVAPPTGTTPPVTLAQPLATAQAPDSGVVLAVGAEKIALPKDAPLPPSGAGVDECASDFGMVIGTFGGVTAIAPASMVLLNGSPGAPDLAKNVGTYTAITELLAALNDAQWQALTSEQGLGLSDLTSDDQTRLFWALFPNRQLLAAPAHADGTLPTPAEAMDLSSDISQAHLRLSQTAQLMPPNAGGHTTYTQVSPYPATEARYVVVHPKQPPRSQVFGQPVRAVVPNEPKTGDLDFDRDALQAPVPLAGIKTVEELVSEIGRTDKLELYADPHYAARSVTFLGDATTVPGGDLLRALAYCVTGTFRKVGPAYVLTDDLTGVAVTQQIWSEYTSEANAARDKPLQQAEAVLSTRRSAFALPTFGDPVAATPAQEQPKPGGFAAKFIPQQAAMPSVPYAQLTPAQQQAAQRVISEYNATHTDEIAKDASQTAVLHGNWHVMPDYRLEAVVPSLPQPVQISREWLGILGMPPEDVLQKIMQAATQWEHAKKLAKAEKQGPVPSLAAVLARARHRAVLAAPDSTDEIKPLVAAMRRLGLNELWLSVFQDGIAQVPGTPLSNPDDASDLLAAALAATRGTGITVFPVLDLFTWGQPQRATQDINVVGENSVQIDARQLRDNPFLVDPNQPPPGVSVSPFTPTVGQDLSQLVQAVAARPGIGGLVWRNAVPDGYDTISDWQGLDTELGYTDAARLAFLRRDHADPWDIPDGDSNLDFHLPQWDDSQADAALNTRWRDFRSGVDIGLLRSLYATAQASAPTGSLPILVEQTRGAPGDDGDWFGTWDNPRLPPPTYHDSDAVGGDGGNSPPPAAAQAKSQSRAALLVLAVTPDDTAAYLALKAQDGLKPGTWDGLMLDVTRADGGPGVAGLSRLAER